MGALGYARDRRETVRDWMHRLAAEPGARAWHTPLAELASLYYRVRFDPAATEELRERFVAMARAHTIPA